MSDVKKKPRSAQERWVAVYPAYINAKKTVQEGRRITQAQAVENPTTQEIFDILQAGNFAPIAEKKMYPRDQTRDWAMQGRVKVQLLNDDDTPKFKEFKTRKELFAYLCETIPKLKSRQPGFSAQSSAQQGSSGGGGGGAKKNKKKK
ncbi:unnamed protein product, partial [Mesorhabditis belari]|uniref:Signal recognition particle 19 kDa protein n=1 Tax=Mesorhabditis belari TaxID=2138241 RepID=A0AAF3ECQ7_9BILA